MYVLFYFINMVVKRAWVGVLKKQTTNLLKFKMSFFALA